MPSGGAAHAGSRGRKPRRLWMTGRATGRYEELVYAKRSTPQKYGINHPDFIGWDGGLPVVAADGTKLAVAMSGFTGEDRLRRHPPCGGRDPGPRDGGGLDAPSDRWIWCGTCSIGLPFFVFLCQNPGSFTPRHEIPFGP